ncbi:hypothetical protein TNCV_1725951 [Trichonephila clavipes]|nr:hypothetical protein TNCV_1725951 [Trichonephila clavipes]
MRIYYRKSNPFNIGFIGNIHSENILRSSNLRHQSNTITVFKNTQTSRSITARVIERDTSGAIYYFIEDSRGFRTHQHGRQWSQNGRQWSQNGRQWSQNGRQRSRNGRQVAKLAANLVDKNDVKFALPPRFRQIFIESPL